MSAIRSAGLAPLPPVPSPRAVRAAAVVVPIASVALGVTARRLWVSRAAVRALAATTLATAVLLTAAGSRSGRRGAPSARSSRPIRDAPSPRMTVLVPAHDEGPVIGGLVRDVAAQTAVGFRLVVIDDGSSDGTGEAAAAEIRSSGLAGRGRVVRREAASGKGAALAAGASPSAEPTGPAGDPPPLAWLVLDADARIEPDFVDLCGTALRDEPAITARRRMLVPRRANAVARLLVRLQDDEQTVDDLVQRGRLAIGGAGEVRGDGMAIRADLLETLGGWPVDAVCEDLEVSSRLFLASGRGARRPAGLVVHEQPVLELRALSRQRVRWAEGSIRRDLRIVLPALLSPAIPLRRRLDVAASALHDAAPWIGVGLLVGAGAPGSGRGRARSGAAELGAAYLVGAWLLAAAALAGDRDDPAPAGPGIALHAALVVAFEAHWPFVLLAAWLRVAGRPSERAFARTPHRPWVAYLAGTAAASERATRRQDPPRWSRSRAIAAPARFHQRGTTR